MPDFTTAIALLRKPIEDAYNLAADTLKTKISRIKVESKTRELHTKLWSSQRVKTLWNIDKPLSLASLYYPTPIQTDLGIKENINTLDELPENHYIVYGTVGQGKSMLMKYLLGRETKSGKRIPILTELRSIQGVSLEEHLSERFSALFGMDRDDDLFKYFAGIGKLSFLLDGVDEIDLASTSKILSQLEDLSFKYVDCRIVISSRPGFDCQTLTNFSSLSISPLAREDLPRFYKKLTKDDDFNRRLLDAIDKSPFKMDGLIQTPLLATLLAISYRAAHKIPLEFSEFYDDLFDLLAVRHDAAKKGWRRARRSQLDDNQLQKTFEAFCYATRKASQRTLDTETAYKLANVSLTKLGHRASPQEFLGDIRDITCLLSKEGAD
ncbi:MAG: NACHT domain-containing NTPase [Leptothrix sp. (in: b-proteobacteria)]